jgi:hypothetical protein
MQILGMEFAKETGEHGESPGPARPYVDEELVADRGRDGARLRSACV